VVAGNGDQRWSGLGQRATEGQARAGGNAGAGQRAPMRQARAGGGTDTGHRPGRRPARHINRWRGRGCQVGDSGDGPAAPSRAMLPQAQAGAGRTAAGIAINRLMCQILAHKNRLGCYTAGSQPTTSTKP
jgi:hypothetical protein